MQRWNLVLVFVHLSLVRAHCNLRHCDYGTGPCQVQFWHDQAGCEARDETVARESFRFDPHALGRCSHRPGGVYFTARDRNTLLLFDDIDAKQCTAPPLFSLKMVMDTCVRSGQSFQPDHPWVRLTCIQQRDGS